MDTQIAILAPPSWLTSAALNLRSEDMDVALRELSGKTAGQLSVLNIIPDDEKIDLIEALYASEFPQKTEVMEKVFSAFELTEGFLNSIVKRVLGSDSRKVGTIGTTSEQRNESLNIEQPKLAIENLAKLIPETKDYLNAVTNETKAHLLMGMLLLGTQGRAAREILAKNIQLNDNTYSLIKHRIKQMQTHNIGTDISREHQMAAAEFILNIPSTSFSKFDDRTWQELTRFLLRIDGKPTITDKWRLARRELFTRMPILKGVQDLHREQGVKFVERALHDETFIQLTSEAEQKWNSADWKENPESKRPFVTAVCTHITDIYDTDLPTIKFGSTSDSKGVEDEANGKYTDFKFGENEKGLVLEWKNIVTLSQSADRGLQTSFYQCLDTVFHEMAHSIEAFIIMGFNIGHRKTYEESGGKKAKSLASTDPLYPTSYIFSHNMGYYSSASQYIKSSNDFALYKAQPVERHAFWFAQHMVNYYRVFRTELAEKNAPGTYAKQILEAVRTVQDIATSLSQSQIGNYAANGVKAAISMSQNKDMQAAQRGEQPLSLKQLEQISLFFEKTELMLANAESILGNNQAFRAHTDNIRQQISSLTLKEYTDYRRYTLAQKIMQPILPDATVKSIPVEAIP